MFHKVFKLLFFFVLGGLPLACQYEEDPSFLKDIYISGPNVKGGYVDILSFTEDQHIVGIGGEGGIYHRVSDCESSELFEILDRDPYEIRDISITTIENSLNYSEGAPLSCSGSFPGNLPGHSNSGHLYYDEEQESYYFGSGKDGFYYEVSQLNTDCAYNFVSRLFAFDQRYDTMIYGPVPQADPEIENSYYRLQCAEPGRNYDLSQVSLGKFRLLVLENISRTAQGTTRVVGIPIYAVDRVNLNTSEDLFNALAAELRDKYGIDGADEEIKSLGWGDFQKMFGKVWFDYCLTSCDDGLPPQHLVTNGSTNNYLGALDAVDIPKLNSSASVASLKYSWSVGEDTYDTDYLFAGCESELMLNLKVATASQGWLSSLKSQIYGQTSIVGSEFVCPKISQPISCERVLNQQVYTVSEIQNIIQGVAECPDATHLKIRVDGPTTIEASHSVLSLGALDLRLSSQFDSVTFESFVPSDQSALTLKIDCGASHCINGESVTFFTVLASNAIKKSLEFNHIDLRLALETSALPEGALANVQGTAILTQDGGTVDLKYSSIGAYAGGFPWATGIHGVAKSTGISNPLCPSCTSGASNDPSKIYLAASAIAASNIGLRLSNSLALVAGQSIDGDLQKSTVIADRTALQLSKNGKLVLVDSIIEGATLASLANDGQLLAKRSRLRFTGSSATEDMNYFLLSTLGLGTSNAIELYQSQISGLPESQVSSFTFANFSTAVDALPRILLRDTNFWRDLSGSEEEVNVSDLSVFLTCDGDGRLYYRLRDYCS